MFSSNEVSFFCGVIEVRGLQDQLGISLWRFRKDHSATTAERRSALTTVNGAPCARRCSAHPVCYSIKASTPSLPSPTRARNFRERKGRKIRCSDRIMRQWITMISTASTLIVLVSLFLVGIKLTIDLIREWPHKKRISSHFEAGRSRRHR
jgi:hypothetical protein